MSLRLLAAAEYTGLGIVICVAVYDAGRIYTKTAIPRRIKSYFTDFVEFSEFQQDASDRLPKRLSQTAKSRLLIVFSSLAVVAHCFGLSCASIQRAGEHEAILGHVTALLCWTYVILRSMTYDLITPPWGTLFVAVSQFAIAVVQATTLLLHSHHAEVEVQSLGWPLFRGVQALAVFAVIATLPLSAVLPSNHVASVTEVPNFGKSSPEDNCSLWSWMTFSHVKPILTLATERTIREIDVYDLPPSFKHEVLLNKYRRTFREGQSLIWWLVSSSSMDLTIYVAARIYNTAVGFLITYALKRILDALEAGNVKIAYLFAFITFITNLSFAQFDLFGGWHSRRVYERTRGLLFCIVFEKALRRIDPTGSTLEVDDQDSGSKEKKKKASADLGKVYNVMRNDSYAIAQRFWDGADIFVAPVGLIVSFCFLYQILGWSALAGAALCVVSVAVQFPLGRALAKLTLRVSNARDKSNSAVTELLSSLRFLKLSAWEEVFLGNVNDARQAALRWRVIQNLALMGLDIVLATFPRAVLVLTFFVYTGYAKERLTISTAFVSISLFARLESSMLELPNAILSYINASVSVKRLQTFLDEEDVEPWVCSLTAPALQTDTEVIGFEQATLEWHAKIRQSSNIESKSDTFRLSDLHISFKRNTLNLVIGETASGKSSLLAGLLGEMDCVQGKVYLPKSTKNVAYCAQNAWLENKTIKANILFSTPYDDARYRKTLEVCALLPDLAVLEGGEDTEIGERGVSLSGGQKARIALARAVYSHSSIVLLDDPLAAVDSHTARTLVDDCLNGELMRGRTIILVTHHVALCTRGEGYLVELEKGRVVNQGSLSDLRATGRLAQITTRQDLAKQEETEEAPKEDKVEGDIDQSKKETKSANPRRGKLTTIEDQAEGVVLARTYLSYIIACGWLIWIGVFFTYAAAQARNLASQYFLQLWGDAYKSLNDTVIGGFHLSSPGKDVAPWIISYFVISLLATVIRLFRNIFSITGQYRASKSVFNQLVFRLTRSSFRLDQTPRGRIMNRTVSDVAVLDGTLFNSLDNCIAGVLAFIVSFGVILVLVPLFAPVALLIACMYFYFSPPYIKSSRDLRRLESISLSPFFQGFDQMLHGLTTIRAYAAEQRYLSVACLDVDRFQRHDHVYWNVSFWLYYRYDILGSAIVFVTQIGALSTGLRAGLVAVLVVQAQQFADASRYLIKKWSQIQLDYNSMERITEYCNVPIESPTESRTRPPAYWPSTSGGMSFINFSARYAPELPFVLRNINLEVSPRQKVALVGRTGSGKSSMALCILRALEAAEGSIIIDGTNIAHIGLHDLRKRITLVSQDVVLFETDVRTNLDPLHEHSDAEIIDVLRRCYLISDPRAREARQSAHEVEEKSTIAFTSLDDKVAADGASLSQGQKQLLALARALLRKSNILIMDEASSSIDYDTDLKIQRTIREELGDTLTLTIAHRLHTCIDYDMVVVLDQGRVAETGSPRGLLDQTDSRFRQMCLQSSDWPTLARMAGVEP